MSDARALEAAERASEERLPLSLCIGFGVGSFGISILLNTVTTFFPVLMTTVLGQSAALAGALLTVSKLYDIIADILIGAASDRTNTRIGRRRPYLLFGAVIAAVSFLMIFIPPALTGEALMVYMGLALIVYSTGYALFAVPYIAMAGEMTDGYHERTRLLSFRAFFVTFGQITASAGTAAIIEWAGGGSRGYAAMGAATAAILFTAMSLCFFGTAKARMAAVPPKSHVPGWSQFKTMLANRPFVILMAIKTTQFMAIAVVSTTKLLFLLNVLKIGYGGLVQLTLVQNVTAAVSVPLWVWFARKVGKRNGYLCATALLAVTYFSWAFTAQGVSVQEIWFRGFLNGIAATGTTLMSISMLPDLMEFDRLRTGQRREGIYSSIYTIVEKVGYAIGPGLIGGLLAGAGFVATTKGAIVQQPQSAISTLYVGMAVLPGALVTLSFLMMLFYRLNEQTLRTERARVAAEAALNEADSVPTI